MCDSASDGAEPTPIGSDVRLISEVVLFSPLPVIHTVMTLKVNKKCFSVRDIVN